MSIINTQAEFDALQTTASEARYIETTDTDFTNTSGDIVLPSGFILTTPNLLSSTQGNFVANNCTINTTDRGLGGTSWRAGNLDLSNSTYIASTTNTGRFVFPGFDTISGENRPTFNYENTIVRNVSLASDFVNTFTSMAATGNNFSGARFLGGSVNYPWGAVQIIGTEFSGDNATLGTATLSTYTRPQRFEGNDRPLHARQFTGYYGSNLTAWDAADVAGVTFLISSSNFVNSALQAHFFAVDNTYSAAWITDGLRAQTVNASADGAPVRVVSGLSWNPTFYSTATTNEISDAIIDFTTNNIWFCNSSDINTLIATPNQDSNGTNNEVSYFSSGARRPGFVIETGNTLLAQNTNARIAVRQPTNHFTNIPFWSYTNQCYAQTNGLNTTISTIDAEIGSFSSELFLDSTDTQIIESNNEEGKLNANDLATATALTTSGISILDDAYSALKAISYNNRLTDVSFGIDGGILSGGFNPIAITSGNFAATSTLTTIGISGNNLNGGTIANTLSAISLSSDVTVSIADMDFNVLTINGNNITIANNCIVRGSGTTINNSQLTYSGVSFEDSPTINLNSGSVYSFSNGSGDITLNLDSGTASVTVTSSFTGTVSSSGAGTINFLTDLGNTMVTIAASEPSGRFIVRDLATNINTAGTHTFGAESDILDIANVSTGATNFRIYYKPNNSGSIFYSTFVQDVANDSNGDANISLISVRHADALTDSAAIATPPTSSLMIDTTDSSKGLVTIGTTGTPSNEAQTLRMFLDLTDDNDYITLLADNEALNDFIRPNKAGTTIDQSILTLTATAQRQLQAVSPQSGFTIADLSGGIPTVIIFPASTGISVADVVAGVNASEVATNSAAAATNAADAATNASAAQTAAESASTEAQNATTEAQIAAAAAQDSKQASIYTARQQNDVQFRDAYDPTTIYETTDI